MIDHLDHPVRTPTDEAACVPVHVGISGLRLERHGACRKAYAFGHRSERTA